MCATVSQLLEVFMYKTITKLSDEQKSTMISDFLTKLGERLELKRRRLNLSQAELADCLEVDRTTLSRYENGTRDMQVSMLPLFSTYCDFPIYELFPRDESQAILDTFAEAVTITVAKKQRQEYKKESQVVSYGSRKKLKGQLYEIDGVEMFEPAKLKMAAQKSARAKYKDAEMVTDYRPCTDEEFCEIVKMRDEEIVDAVLKAGQFLEQIEKIPSKDSLKEAVADYVIDELVISEILQKYPDMTAQRVYAYYKALYQRIKADVQGGTIRIHT